MCDKPRTILPIYLADVVDGALRISWSVPFASDGTPYDYRYTAGRIASAIAQGHPVHIVGWSCFGTDSSAPLGYVSAAVDEVGTGRIMDPILVTTEDTAECRIKLRNPDGITITIDGAGAVSEAVLQFFVEIEGDCE
jgi:hypothetical protein